MLVFLLILESFKAPEGKGRKIDLIRFPDLFTIGSEMPKVKDINNSSDELSCLRQKRKTSEADTFFNRLFFFPISAISDFQRIFSANPWLTFVLNFFYFSSKHASLITKLIRKEFYLLSKLIELKSAWETRRWLFAL